MSRSTAPATGTVTLPALLLRIERGAVTRGDEEGC
jgi:hypothetical protein